MSDIGLNLPESYSKGEFENELSRILDILEEKIAIASQLRQTSKAAATGSGDQVEKELHFARNDDGTIDLVFRIFGENHTESLTKET